MAQIQQQTITVDRMSNSGNAIADQQQAGKSVHAPADEVEVGGTYEVRLVDRGSHFQAKLIDSAEQIHPSQPSVSPDTSDLAKGRRSDTYSHEIRSSPAGEKLRATPDTDGKKRRQQLSRRKK